MGCGATSMTSTAKDGSTVASLENPGRIRDYYEWDPKAAKNSILTAQVIVSKENRSLKMISRSDDSAEDKFKREIALFKLLDHPNIIKLHETFKDRKYYYLIMQNCSGGELFDVIVEQERFTETQAASLMKQIMRPILYLHDNGVCHRNVKPEVFIFFCQGPLEKSTLKLIDFSVACHCGPGKFLTQSIGVPQYVAPEVLEGEYNQAIDVWSCGVIMYIMLSGYPPFRGVTDEEVLSKVCSGQVDFDTADWSNVSQGAIALIKRMLEVSPAKRITARQVHRDVWVEQQAPGAEDVKLSDSVLDSMRNFRNENALKQAALQVISTNLNEDKIRHMREVFQSIDTDGDGVLTAAEMTAALERGGQDIPADLFEILKGLDTNGTGNIEYSEFLSASIDARNQLQESTCWSAFCEFDADGNGSITRDEFLQVLRQKDIKSIIDVQDVDSLIKQIDTNGDGVIDFEEFMGMLKNPTNVDSGHGAKTVSSPTVTQAPTRPRSSGGEFRTPTGDFNPILPGTPLGAAT